MRDAKPRQGAEMRGTPSAEPEVRRSQGPRRRRRTESTDGKGQEKAGRREFDRGCGECGQAGPALYTPHPPGAQGHGEARRSEAEGGASGDRHFLEEQCLFCPREDARPEVWGSGRTKAEPGGAEGGLEVSRRAEGAGGAGGVGVGGSGGVVAPGAGER